jgi:hypothetical protein
MATFKRESFGQVEPTHLSAQRNGAIYAQWTYDGSAEFLENGQFLFFKQGKLVENLGANVGSAEPFLVFNEVKLYDGWRESYADFAMKPDNAGVMTPRVVKTAIGDTVITNTLKNARGTQNITVAAGDVLVVNEYGFLDVLSSDDLSKGQDQGSYTQAEYVAAHDRMAWQVTEITTMADGKTAVKVVRIK